jgi:hypothetical protein
MRRAPSATQQGRPDLGPDDTSAAMRTWKSAWALIRWVLLIASVGVGIAAVIAIVLAAAFALAESSL